MCQVMALGGDPWEWGATSPAYADTGANAEHQVDLVFRDVGEFHGQSGEHTALAAVNCGLTRPLAPPDNHHRRCTKNWRPPCYEK